MVIVGTRYRRGVTVRGLQPANQLFTRRGAENNRNNHYETADRRNCCVPPTSSNLSVRANEFGGEPDRQPPAALNNLQKIAPRPSAF